MGFSLNKYLSQGDRLLAAKAAKSEYAKFQGQLNQDLKRTLKVLNDLKDGGMTLEEEEEILRKAGKPLVDAAQRLAPVSNRNRVTVTSKDGRKKFFIERGNLKASIMEIRFKRRRHGRKGKLRGRSGGVVVFGPKVHWKPRNKQRFGPSVKYVNAYYAAMVEFGTMNASATPFMRPAYESTKGLIIGKVRSEVTRAVKKWAQQNQYTSQIRAIK